MTLEESLKMYENLNNRYYKMMRTVYKSSGVYALNETISKLNIQNYFNNIQTSMQVLRKYNS